MTTVCPDPELLFQSSIATLEALRKGANDAPYPRAVQFEGRPLKVTAGYRNPHRVLLQGFAVLVCQFEDDTVLLRAVDAVGMRESGQCETTLAQLGVPTYQKLLAGFCRLVVYRKNGDICIVLRRKNMKPWGAAALNSPVTPEQQTDACLTALLFCALLGREPRQYVRELRGHVGVPGQLSGGLPTRSHLPSH